jgi:GDP-4-dehydro-6-deoxy-D-mannose reductase
MTRRKLLITGASGFTGRHAVRYFAEEGAQVTAVVRCRGGEEASSAAARDFPEGVSIYYCDLSDRKAVETMIEATAPDDVLHLAGKNSVPESWRDPLLYIESNVMATLYLLEAMRSLPHSRILVAGSRLKFKPGTAAGPPHPYSLSKTLEELGALAWGTLFRQPVLMAEPCNLIGPGPSTGFCSLLSRHIVGLEEGQELPMFQLSSRYDLRDFLDVRDAVTAYGFILRQGETGTVYRIDSGKQRELGEIAEFLIGHSAVPVPLDWGRSSAQPQKLEPAGLSESKGSTPIVASSQQTPEMSAATLGWTPQIRLEESLRDILDYYRSCGEGRLL